MKKLGLLMLVLLAACSGDAFVPDVNIPDANGIQDVGTAEPDASAADAAGLDAHVCEGPGANAIYCGGECVRPGDCCCVIEGISLCGFECA